MLRLCDSNGNSLPCNVEIDAVDPGSFEIFAVDDNNGPVLCTWVLAARGGTVPVAVTGYPTYGFPANQDVEPPVLGTLEGPLAFYRPIIVPTNPSTSQVYYPPAPYTPTSGVSGFADQFPMDVVITATPTNGENQRAINIRVNNTSVRAY